MNEDHLVVLVRKSKTDQYRDGNKVYIAKTNGQICHYSLLLRYFSLAKIDLHTDDYIFRTMKPLRRKSTYSLGPRRLSYTRCREIIKESLSAIGIDPKPFSTHSLRPRGATFMAKSQAGNSHINRLLKLQG